MIQNSLIRFLLICALSAQFSQLANAVTYEISFNGNWTPELSEPGTYPGNAHFTRIIAATHSQGTAFWQRGAVASLGVETVAELGITTDLLNDLQRRQVSGDTGVILDLDDQFSFPATSQTRFDVENNTPYLSLITMIAPSPDWFVGVSELPLQENGQWLEQIVVELKPYDAGTEVGNTFSLSNPNTADTGIINPLSGDDSPFIGEPTLATLVLRLIQNDITTPEPVNSLPRVNSDVPLAAVYTLLFESPN